MNNFTKRALTGVVFVIVLLSCTLFNEYSFATLFFFFSIVGSVEYLNIVDKDERISTNRSAAIVLSVLTFLVLTSNVTLLEPTTLFIAPILLPVVFIILSIELFRLKSFGFSNILHTIAPALFIALPFALFVSWGYSYSHRAGAYEGHLAILFFIALWSNDTGAYLSGKTFGKHKLFPVISPNKTWEGTVGGAILSIAGAMIYSIYVENITYSEAVTVAFIVVIFGSIGDLVQSMLKRNYQVKDAGTIFPGHGGVLDRFDGLLLAGPLLFSAYELYDLIELIYSLAQNS